MTGVSNDVESLADTSVELGGAALTADVPDAVDVLFPAETAARWVRRHHAALFRYHDPAAEGGRLLTTEELVRDVLPSQAEQLVADGTPRPAAGMYLAGWYAGTAAEFVGLSLLGSGAGYLLDPASTRWWRNPDGYADALDFADVNRVVVLPDHPWSGQPDTHTVTTRAEQAEFVVTALVETVAPTIDALQHLTRAGRAGLWHQVADAIGAALVDQDAVSATPEAVDLLRGLLAADARPWKRPPRVEVLATGGGPVWVTHKGGCCMAFTEPAADDLDLDDYDAAFQQAFPRTDGRPDYCVTCKFRPFEEAVRMQLWRRERLA